MLQGFVIKNIILNMDTQKTNFYKLRLANETKHLRVHLVAVSRPFQVSLAIFSL